MESVSIVMIPGLLTFHYVISVFIIMIPRLSVLSLYPDCLDYYDIQTVLIIIIPGVSTLLLYLECLPYYDILVKLVEFCLSYSDRQSVYVVTISGPRFSVVVFVIMIPRVSKLLTYLDCLFYYDI